MDSGNGKELYGDDYADIWAINRLHFKAASPLVCDHVSKFILISSVCCSAIGEERFEKWLTSR